MPHDEKRISVRTLDLGHYQLGIVWSSGLSS
jgi:hypothetical protein